MKINRVIFWRILFGFSAISLTAILFNVESYKWTYWFLLFLLLCSGNVRCGVTMQFLSYFLLGYLGIALLDVTHYRGVLALETLQMYSIVALVVFVGLLVIDLALVFIEKRDVDSYNYLGSLSSVQRKAIVCHLCIVFIALTYLYNSLGIIILNQELRFDIPPYLSYVVKSSIYIPLVYWVTGCFRDWPGYFLYVFLPLLPATLIGSRGTVVMVLLGVYFIHILQGRTVLPLTHKVVQLQHPVRLLGGLALVVGLIYIPYYIRRLVPGSSFLTPSETLNEYYFNDSWVGYILMPLHLGFKETVMLTNNIIIKQIENVYTVVPLFFVDLFTVLPGKQMGAGEVMRSVFGAVAAGGLTPGIVGGLYIDFKSGTIVIIFSLVIVIYVLERLSRFSDRFLILYVLSFIQFLHLFHRGFLKPEYLFSYLIILFYLVLGDLSKRKMS